MANWDASEGGGNAFVNDGSFMETFKRLQEQQKDKGSESTTAEEKEERSSSSGGAAEGFTRSSRRTTESETGDQGKVSEKKATGRTTVTTDPPLVKASQVAECMALNQIHRSGLGLIFPVCIYIHCAVHYTL